jgi:hypothetical protein
MPELFSVPQMSFFQPNAVFKQDGAPLQLGLAMGVSLNKTFQIDGFSRIAESLGPLTSLV